MKIIFVFLLTTFANLPLLSHAFSSVAIVPGQAIKTIYAGWNWPTQKEADKVAVDGCRTSAKKNGIPQFADRCRVDFRQKGAGAGAIVCGSDECAYVAGFSTRQAAVDAAYKHCAAYFNGCQENDIMNWWDEAGYAKTSVRSVGQGNACSPPTGEAVRSKTQCMNGDCIRTFENGCQVRFRAPYCHDPVSGKWEWKPDGC
jgi:hypothetical protein